MVVLFGYDEDFDPLANLSQTSQGAVLDLGDGDGVVFLGRLVAEFNADDFSIIAG